MKIKPVSEWPQVGDKIFIKNEDVFTFENPYVGVVKCKFTDSGTDIIVSIVDGNYYCVDKDDIREPSNVELLTWRIFEETRDTALSTSLAEAIIAGEIDGLVYNGD